MSEVGYLLDGGLTAAVLYLVYDLRMRIIKIELVLNGNSRKSGRV